MGRAKYLHLFTIPLIISSLIGSPVATPKRPLNHKDFDSWRSVAGTVISRDGRYLAYSFMPQEGDGDLIVRDLLSGTEWRECVGALPAPPIQNPEEVNPESPPQSPGIRIAITSDSRFVVATTYPRKAETETAKKANKKPEEMPKGGLLVLNTQTGQCVQIPAVKNMQVPSKGGSWLAYLKEPGPEDKKNGEPAATKDSNSGGQDKKKEYGTELVLRDLSKAQERIFSDVLEYSFSRDAQTLLFAVSARNEEANGVFALSQDPAQAPTPVLTGKGKYAKLTWDREQRQAAFVSDRDSDSKVPGFRVYRWQRGTPSAVEVVSSRTASFPPALVVSDKGSLGFSRDGARLYVAAGISPKPSRNGDSGSSDEKVVADLWHWKDDAVQPMQRIRANQERSRTYRGVYHIAEGRYVQIGDRVLRTVSFSDDGRHAIGLDDSPYRTRVDYDGNYADVYLIDTSTGVRTEVLKQFRTSGGSATASFRWSPDGQFACYFADQQWHLLNTSSGTARNLTSSLSVPFSDEEDDTPDPPSSYGGADWTSDSRSFLVYDRYDVWQFFVDDRAPRNLTEGEGRRLKQQLRVQRIEPDDDEQAERGIDTAAPLYLRGECEATRATGFLKDSFNGSAPPERLLWSDKAYRFVAKAREAGTVLVSASRFDEYPDLHVTDAGFRSLKKVTEGGKQLDHFLWGKAELVPFENGDGVPLKAALYKPENFDPTRKYPLLVYIYERLSQNVHNFVTPAPGHNVNLSFYVSNGYLVLTPDIVYTVGSPGQSALKCVLPAVQAVVSRGFVDENAIGIQGHSWGGYQVAYMVTQTNRFRAAEAGAPVGNMTSAYSGIRWGSGMPRQFQYEQTQSRIGAPLHQAPFKYLENSPVFHIDRVKTPLLLLHNDQDDAVPWYQGIELFLALRRNGKEAYLFNYNGEFHGLRKRCNQKDYAIRLQQFFDHFLKRAPKPEWMERGIPFLEREDEKERFHELSDRMGK
ncbi:MAG: S9 family peptidase [Acidobacteria bacterium]|nr:MAG: S9 family peptidase [Acidobacteriota bacterium]